MKRGWEKKKEFRPLLVFNLKSYQLPMEEVSIIFKLMDTPPNDQYPSAPRGLGLKCWWQLNTWYVWDFLSSNLANVVRFWVICKDLFFQEVVPVMNFYLKSLSNFSYCSCVLQSVERRKGKKRGLFFKQVRYNIMLREDLLLCAIFTTSITGRNELELKFQDFDCSDISRFKLPSALGEKGENIILQSIFCSCSSWLLIRSLKCPNLKRIIFM